MWQFESKDCVDCGSGGRERGENDRRVVALAMAKVAKKSGPPVNLTDEEKTVRRSTAHRTALYLFVGAGRASRWG